MKTFTGRFALAGKLFGSTAAAQGAALVATTVAATRMQPVDFAIYAAVRAATGILAAVNALAAETRIPVVSEKDAGSLVRVASTSVVATTVVTVIAGLAGWSVGAGWARVTLLLAPCALAVAAMNVLTAGVIRANQPHLLARNRVVGGFSNAALIVALVFTPLAGDLVLTLAFVVSTVLSTWVLLPGVPGWLRLMRPAHHHDWRVVRREVGWQPLNNLTANLGTALPALLLPAFGATVIAGAWALISRIMNAVVNVVFSTTSPIYTAEFARLVREGDPRSQQSYHARWVLRLLLLAVPSIVGIIVGVRWIIPLLGDQWRPTSLVLAPACVSFTALMIWLPMSQTLVLIGRTTLELVWTLGNLVASAVPLVLIPWLGASRALTVWAAVQVVSLVVHVLVQRRAIADPAGPPPPVHTTR